MQRWLLREEIPRMSASDPGSIAKIAAGEPVVITDMALVEVRFD